VAYTLLCATAAVIIAAVSVLLIDASEDSAYGQTFVPHPDGVLTDSRNGHAIRIQFVDGAVSGYVQPAGRDRVALNPDTAAVTESGGRLTVVDSSAMTEILMRETSAERYLIMVKMNAGDGSGELRIRFVADPSSPPLQRDFMAEQEAMQRAVEEAESAVPRGELDKQEKLERASEEVRRFIEREQQRASSSGPTSEEILAQVAADQNPDRADPARGTQWYEWNQADAGADRNPDRADPERGGGAESAQDESEDTQDEGGAPAEPVLSESHTKTFLSVPLHVEWDSDLKYSVLVTDDKQARFDTKFKTFIGDRIAGANVTVNIVAPDGLVLGTFNGTTAEDGMYRGGWIVPDNHETGTEHKVTANSTVIFADNTYAVSEGEAPFFVNPSRTSSSPPRFLNATLDTSNGNMTVTFSKIINATQTVLSNLYISDADKVDEIALTNATLKSALCPKILCVTLNSTQRDAVRMMDTPQLDIGANAVFRTAGSPIAAAPDNQINLNR